MGSREALALALAASTVEWRSPNRSTESRLAGKGRRWGQGQSATSFYSLKRRHWQLSTWHSLQHGSFEAFTNTGRFDEQLTVCGSFKHKDKRDCVVEQVHLNQCQEIKLHWSSAPELWLLLIQHLQEHVNIGGRSASSQQQLKSEEMWNYSKVVLLVCQAR